MNRNFALSFVALLLISSCGTYSGEGAATGGYFGAILGSAIGGISGGSRGSDIGTLAGVVGGAVVGAAIGSAADKAAQASRYPTRDYGYDDYSPTRDSYDYNRNSNSYDNRQSEYDDRIDFETDGKDSAETDAIEIRNVKFVDADNDRQISGGEVCKISFEIMNRSRRTVYNITPEVTETTGNKHIYISPSVLVENIAPHKGIRYTASIGADRRIKNGYIKLQLSAKQQGERLATTITSIGTVKKK